MPLDAFEQIFQIYFHENGRDVIYMNFVISSNYCFECWYTAWMLPSFLTDKLRFGFNSLIIHVFYIDLQKLFSGQRHRFLYLNVSWISWYSVWWRLSQRQSWHLAL